MYLGEIKGYIFDPVLPEEQISVTSIRVDDANTDVIIKRELIEKLKTVPELGTELVEMSYGIKVRLPYVEIGIKIGSIKFNNVKALIADENAYYDLVLGKNVISELFNLENIQISNRKKDGKELLSIRIHSVDNSYKILNVENFLRETRRLFNILMVINGEVEIDTLEEFDNVIDSEIGIPENKKLKLSWIEEGSILIVVKSVADALKSIADLISTFRKKPNGKENKTEESRDQIVVRQKEDEKKLKPNNIPETYNQWREKMIDERKEMKDRISTLKRMKNETENKKLILKIQIKIDEIIERLINQEMYPEVINVPDPKLLGDNSRNLPILYEE